jgi:hypothetical protein
MDVKVSQRETRIQPTGPVEVLMTNICDLYPVFGHDPLFSGQDQGQENLIIDVETLDDDRAELLDRAMFSVIKQRGGDPVEPDDGIQWAEAVLEEVSPIVIVQQVRKSVSEEGPGVRAFPGTTKRGMRETLNFTVELTNAV